MLLGLFRDLQFLQTSQLERLLVPDPFGSTDAFRQRLGKLQGAGYLTQPSRVLRPLFAEAGRPAHRPENIFAITNKGARAVNLAGEFDKNTQRRRGQDPFSHGLLISHVYSALRLGARAGAYEFLDWQPENSFREMVPVTTGAGTESLPICPDGKFVLADAESELDYFLECDTGSEPLKRSEIKKQSSILKKCLAYHGLWKAERDANSQVAFIVLFVTTTDARAAALTEAARLADPRGQGLGLFYFASTERWSLNDPEPFWSEPIWLTPSGERRKLFE